MLKPSDCVAKLIELIGDLFKRNLGFASVFQSPNGIASLWIIKIFVPETGIIPIGFADSIVLRKPLCRFVYERAGFCVRDMEVLTVAGVAYGRCLNQFSSKIDNVDFGWPVLIVSVDRGD